MVPDTASKAQVAAMKLTKTKMCKFEAWGSCSKGAQCPYAHSSDELNPLPDLRRTKLCKRLIQNGVCDNPGCTFAHDKEELRMPPSVITAFRTKTCRFFVETGSCKLGSRCSFSHDIPEEMRGSAGSSLQSEDHAPLEMRPLLPPVPDFPPAPVAPGLPKKVREKGSRRIHPPPGLEATFGRFGGEDLKVVQQSVDSPAYVARIAEPTPWDSYLHSFSQAADSYCQKTDLLVGQQLSMLRFKAMLAGFHQGATLIPDIPLSHGLRDPRKPLLSARSSESTICSLSDLLA
mmetsp:Transcript_90157/g.255535  ORF Transcript_90157/g.255535 Transcript_90157/m.255535 type:complete len:289 (+) Transcript_90157:40-906(+)